jgi:transcriptional regulator with XRE-family HTH domain
MEDLPEIVALNLRRLRRQRKLTQEELALRAEIDRSYLGNIERAEYSITVVTLGRLAKALLVLPGELLDLPPQHPFREALIRAETAAAAMPSEGRRSAKPFRRKP